MTNPLQDDAGTGDHRPELVVESRQEVSSDFYAFAVFFNDENILPRPAARKAWEA
jgi:hypothetical protein